MRRQGRTAAFIAWTTLAIVSPAGADVIADWTVCAPPIIAAGRATIMFGAGPSTQLDLATVHLAMHDAVQAHDRRFEPYAAAIAAGDGSAVAAAARAAHALLLTKFPAQLASCDYQLIVRTNRWNRTGRARLFLDDRELEFGAGPGAQLTSTAAAPTSRRPRLATARLEAGHPYRVRVEFRQTGTGGMIQLAWIPPADGALAEAERVVRDADVAVVCVGLSGDLEAKRCPG